MKKIADNSLPNELDELCVLIRALVEEKKYDECFTLIRRSMENYPHAPHPHNLLGIVLEKTGDHAKAMRHFRAAWALDPTYLPASHNLNTYGTFFSRGSCAFDESDVSMSFDTGEKKGRKRQLSDSHGENKIQYEIYGS